MSWSAIVTPDASASINNIGTPYEHGIEFALSSDGTTGILAWITGSGGAEICKASRLVSGSWTSPENVLTAIGAGAAVAAVQIDGLGKPLVVVRRDSVNLATLHRWDGGWGQIGPEFARSDANGGIFATSASQPVPATICNLTAGTRDIIIMSTGSGGVRFRRNIGGNWAGDWPTLPGTATGATLGAIYRASSGTLHTITRHADNRIVHHTSTDSGINWSAGTIISNAGTLGSHVRSAFVSATSILAVWSTTGGNTAWSLYNGTSWTTPALVTGPTASFASGNVQFSGDTLTYGKAVNGVTQIFAKRFASGAWGSEYQVTSAAANVTIHTTACTANGTECFVAYSSSGSQALTVRRRVNGNWYDSYTFSGTTGWYPQGYENGSRLAMFSGAKTGISILDTNAARTLSTRGRMSGTVLLKGDPSKATFTSLTNAWETSVGSALLRGQTLTGPTTLYAALFTAAPGETGSQVAEVSGNGYQRTAITFSTASPDGVFANSASCLFPEATGSWGTLSFIGLMTAQSGGDMVMSFPLIDAAGEPTTQPIIAGDRPEIAAGDLVASFL